MADREAIEQGIRENVESDCVFVRGLGYIERDYEVEQEYDDEHEHEWELIDESFTHALGTERCQKFEKCASCGEKREFTKEQSAD